MVPRLEIYGTMQSCGGWHLKQRFYPMRGEITQPSREKAAGMEQLRASIGQWLKQEYDSYIDRPLPDRLAGLLRQIAQSADDS